MSQTVARNQSSSHFTALCWVPRAFISESGTHVGYELKLGVREMTISLILWRQTSHLTWLSPLFLFFCKRELRLHTSQEFCNVWCRIWYTLSLNKWWLSFLSSSPLILLRYWNIWDLWFKNVLYDLVWKMELGNIFIARPPAKKIWTLFPCSGWDGYI